MNLRKCGEGIKRDGPATVHSASETWSGGGNPRRDVWASAFAPPHMADRRAMED